MNANERTSNSGRLRTAVIEIVNCVNPHQPWCLRWQTTSMAAPAFWYFETEARARHEEQCLHDQNRGIEERSDRS